MSPIEFDLTRYPIPNQLFINGEWVDSKAKKTQSLSSAVNDQVICTGRDVFQESLELCSNTRRRSTLGRL